MDEDDVKIFGGGTDAPAVREDLLDTPEALAAALASRMSPQAQRVARTAMYTTKEGIATPHRTIATVDEAGNPIIPGLQQAVEQDTGVDEDGVPAA
jgi:hypothetical protein